MADEKEIVDLVLNAKYLNSDELNKMSNDVEELGLEVVSTTKKLDQLKIDSANITSFKKLSSEVDKLGTELDTATAKYKLNSAELKKNKSATQEQITINQKMGRELKTQNKTYNARVLELNKVDAALTKSGINVKELTGLEKKYSAEIKQTQKELKNTKLVRDQEVAGLEKEYLARKKIIDQKKVDEKISKAAAAAKEKASKESVAALNKEINAAKKVQAARDKKTASDKAAAAEAARVTAGVQKYEAELTKLHNEYKTGAISKVKYVKGEANLRRELKLTEKQVRDTNRAIAADTSEKKARTTDLLTSATRRLAQAYTVLLAAQKSAQAVVSSVQSYSELESAQIKVAKTTNLMRDQIVGMTDEFIKLSNDVTPTATNELLRYAEVAGQLGVEGTENILRMATAADALNVSTNLAGDEAATLLTRILTMTKEGVPAINDLASVVVELGNNTATTEAEIVQMTKEIVTGTTAIGLNSSAAAALGATLKELGQTGERSRSAFTRLSATINDAVTDGGKDLELLQKITGQTGDELERNLKERPEVIIQDFINGLGRLREEGISTKNTLNEFGITAGESVQVFDALANNTERYARAVKLAGAAQQDGTKHLQEASKAYASQENSLLRLQNKFIDLKTSIGEAYSDEVYESIQGATDLLEANKEAVISFMESMLEFGEGLKEIFVDLTELDDILGSLVGNTSLLNSAFNSLKSGFNAIQASINSVIRSVVDVNIVYKQWLKSMNLLSSSGEAELQSLIKSHHNLSAAIDRDMQDIINASLDMSGESSDAYRDLIDNSGKYEDAVAKLSDTQKAQLTLILESGKYNAELQGEYRDLTSAIISNQNQLEVLNKQKELLIKSDEKAATAAAKKLKVEQDSVQANKDIVEQYKATGRAIEVFNKLLDDGTIGVQRHYEVIKDLEKAQKDLRESVTSVGVIYEDVSKTIDSTEISYEGMSSAAIELTGVIAEQKNELKELQKVIDSKTASDEDQAQAQRDLIIVGRELKDNQEQLILLNKIDAASSNELISIKRDLVKSLEELNQKQLLGKALTDQEVIDKALLESAIGRLNERIGEHKDVTDEDTDAVDDNVESLKGQSEAFDDNTQAVDKNKKSKEDLLNAEFNNSASASAHVNAQLALQQQYDFTSLSIDELTEKYRDLNGQIWMNVQSSQEWFGDLHDLTQASNRHQAATIEQTIAMKQLQEKVESGSLSFKELEQAANNAIYGFEKLDDSQLDPLRSAIENARKEFEALDESINRSFDRTQDRLDELLGNEADILAREFQREMEEAQTLLDQARDSGNNDLVDRAQQNIANLTKAQNIELQQYKAEADKAKAEALQAKKDAESSTSNTNTSTTTNTANTTPGVGGSVRVELSFSSIGVTQDINVLGQNDADSLLSALELLAANNLTGVN